MGKTGYVALLIILSILVVVVANMVVDDGITEYDFDDISMTVVVNPFYSNHYDSDVINEEIVEAIDDEWNHLHLHTVVHDKQMEFEDDYDAYLFGEKANADIVVWGSVDKVFGNVERIEYNVVIIDEDLRHQVIYYEPEISKNITKVIKINPYSDDSLETIGAFNRECNDLFSELIHLYTVTRNEEYHTEDNDGEIVLVNTTSNEEIIIPVNNYDGFDYVIVK